MDNERLTDRDQDLQQNVEPMALDDNKYFSLISTIKTTVYP